MRLDELLPMKNIQWVTRTAPSISVFEIARDSAYFEDINRTCLHAYIRVYGVAAEPH